MGKFTLMWNKKDFEKGISLIEAGQTFVQIAAALNKTSNSVRCYFNRKGYMTLTTQAKFIVCLGCGKKVRKTVIVNGKAIHRRERFCNNSCSAKYSNSRRTRVKLERKVCLACGEKCKSVRAKYCSKACMSAQKEKNAIEKIKNGDTGNMSDWAIRKYMIVIYGAKCMICGWSEINPVTKKVPIQLNHKDGNYENRHPSNLELLCPNHHSLTSNFGILNIGNGRHKRRERYRQGKSR